MGTDPDDDSTRASNTALAVIEEQADATIRRTTHEGRMFFSVIDVIAVLTDSTYPNRYWTDMKRRMSDEGAGETYDRVVQLRLRAPDGRMRATDCADAETLWDIRRLVPAAAAWRVRREHRPQCMLYAIGLQDGSMVKNGTTTNLTSRLRTLRCSSPVPVILLWQAEGDSRIERELHRRFAHRRVYGEWFGFAGADVNAELQAAITEIRGHEQ